MIADVLLGDEMKKMTVIVLCLALASCAGTKSTVADPIDALVKRLDVDKGVWQNGGSPEIDLPSDAKPKEVIAAAVRWQAFDKGMIKSYQIEEIRHVDLWDINGNKEQYAAALLKTDLGPKVIVFNFKTFGRWWARFYPVEEGKQNRLPGN